MVYGKKRNFIFVHIPKNGGTSIRNTLNKHQENWRFFRWCQRADKKLRFKKAEYEVSRFVLKTFSFLNLALPLQWKYFRYHEPISTLKKSDYDGYLKFCIIPLKFSLLKSF